MRVILASGSPRRRELLKKIYDEFEIITSDVIEETTETEPGKIVEALSMLKAQAVFSDIVNENSEDTIVIGADTIVYYDSEVLLKPKDEEERIKTLALLNLQIKALIARDLFDINEYYRIINENSDIVKAALQQLQ